MQLNAWYFPFVGLLGSVATAIVLAYGGILYFDDAITIGTLFAFMLFLANFFDPIQALSQLFNTFLAASAALDKIFDVMDTAPELRDAEGARPLPQIEGAVELSDVHFHYGEGAEVLHGIDLSVAAGQTVALVGHTAPASGRVKLLARSTTPRRVRSASTATTCGTCRCARYAGQLGIVPQEVFVRRLIRDNIALADPMRPRGSPRRRPRGGSRQVH